MNKLKEKIEEILSKYEVIASRTLTKDLLSLFEAERKKAEEKIRKRIEILMDVKIAKQLGDNFEKFTSKRQCDICGTNPEQQREMILAEIKGETKDSGEEK